MKPNPAKYPSEAALCAAFIAALPLGWTAYAETGGFDILLVRSDGCQIGVEAKLRLNAEVLLQATERDSYYAVTLPGPDYRAVLVPRGAAGSIAGLAAYCGVTVIMMPPSDAHPLDRRFQPALPRLDGSEYELGSWREMLPSQRLAVPEYVPDVPAGVAGPVQLTKWKVAALKLSVLLEETGYLTRHDFKRFGVDHRRWISGGWIRADNGVWVCGGPEALFRRQHPRVWEEIKADTKKWARPAGVSVVPQPALFG